MTAYVCRELPETVSWKGTGCSHCEREHNRRLTRQQRRGRRLADQEQLPEWTWSQ